MTRKSQQLQDETRYCENCGISFIWTLEEHRVNLHESIGAELGAEEEFGTGDAINADQPEAPIISPDASSDDASGEIIPVAVSSPRSVAERTFLSPNYLSPNYCPGCRYLLPAPGRERGLVKWYHRRKGYGFIIRKGAADLYVNRSALRRGHLMPGELVEFVLSHNQQGLMADHVTIIENAGTGY